MLRHVVAASVIGAVLGNVSIHREDETVNIDCYPAGGVINVRGFAHHGSCVGCKGGVTTERPRPLDALHGMIEKEEVNALDVLECVRSYTAEECTPKNGGSDESTVRFLFVEESGGYQSSLPLPKDHKSFPALVDDGTCEDIPVSDDPWPTIIDGNDPCAQEKKASVDLLLVISMDTLCDNWARIVVPAIPATGESDGSFALRNVEIFSPYAETKIEFQNLDGGELNGDESFFSAYHTPQDIRTAFESMSISWADATETPQKKTIKVKISNPKREMEAEVEVLVKKEKLTPPVAGSPGIFVETASVDSAGTETVSSCYPANRPYTLMGWSPCRNWCSTALFDGPDAAPVPLNLEAEREELEAGALLDCITNYPASKCVPKVKGSADVSMRFVFLHLDSGSSDPSPVGNCPGFSDVTGMTTPPDEKITCAAKADNVQLQFVARTPQTDDCMKNWVRVYAPGGVLKVKEGVITNPPTIVSPVPQFKLSLFLEKGGVDTSFGTQQVVEAGVMPIHALPEVTDGQEGLRLLFMDMTDGNKLEVLLRLEYEETPGPSPGEPMGGAITAVRVRQIDVSGDVAPLNKSYPAAYTVNVVGYNADGVCPVSCDLLQRAPLPLLPKKEDAIDGVALLRCVVHFHYSECEEMMLNRGDGPVSLRFVFLDQAFTKGSSTAALDRCTAANGDDPNWEIPEAATPADIVDSQIVVAMPQLCNSWAWFYMSPEGVKIEKDGSLHGFYGCTAAEKQVDMEITVETAKASLSGSCASLREAIAGVKLPEASGAQSATKRMKVRLTRATSSDEVVEVDFDVKVEAGEPVEKTPVPTTDQPEPVQHVTGVPITQQPSQAPESPIPETPGPPKEVVLLLSLTTKPTREQVQDLALALKEILQAIAVRIAAVCRIPNVRLAAGITEADREDSDICEAFGVNTDPEEPPQEERTGGVQQQGCTELTCSYVADATVVTTDEPASLQEKVEKAVTDSTDPRINLVEKVTLPKRVQHTLSLHYNFTKFEEETLQDVASKIARTLYEALVAVEPVVHVQVDFLCKIPQERIPSGILIADTENEQVCSAVDASNSQAARKAPVLQDTLEGFTMARVIFTTGNDVVGGLVSALIELKPQLEATGFIMAYLADVPVQPPDTHAPPSGIETPSPLRGDESEDSSSPVLVIAIVVVVVVLLIGAAVTVWFQRGRRRRRGDVDMRGDGRDVEMAPQQPEPQGV